MLKIDRSILNADVLCALRAMEQLAGPSAERSAEDTKHIGIVLEGMNADTEPSERIDADRDAAESPIARGDSTRAEAQRQRNSTHAYETDADAAKCRKPHRDAAERDEADGDIANRNNAAGGPEADEP